MSAPSAGKAEDRPVSTRVPPAEVLLDAAADYLDLELRPLLEGYHAFQLRVCVNVLRLVARELRLGPAADARARAGLAALLGESAAAEARADAPAPDDALRAEIASGRLPLDSPALLAHLREGLRDGLAINNPRWVQPGGDTGG
ncbi:MAG: hypothetical protein KBC94_23825 [Pseudacidovorax sp.]|uniref:DUF6285 domain-containing protein n=1 Tax=Pseudacidovorax sp. TaxID=1934311 RepID=UPI001B7B6455|nr:DUF6285 domain-containing protein [Pseudacidovorax sp.]MBP6897459.1 hypothetical protein [Pseudacidovorax sp.]